MTVRAAVLCLLAPLSASLAAGSARAQTADPMDRPFARISASRPAVIEANWTPMRMPNGQRIAMAGFSYLMAVDEGWGFGPSVYGAAQGDFGGLITVGASAQRRWRVGQNTHLAMGLYAGAGGGLSSDQVRYGGGLMLRPEISLRTEFDNWYAGIGVAHVRFPGGNVRDTSLTVSLGRATSFASFSPDDAGRTGRSTARLGMGFDEVTLYGGYYAPGGSTRDRSGQPNRRRMGFAGADLRQYIAEGSWWGFEAAGAAQGGASGYMDMSANVGQDWALWRGSPLRVGAQLGLGLGGGGNVDTGSGWIARGGPTLRWQTPWGPSLRLDGGLLRSISGHFSASYWRVGLSLPLDKVSAALGGDGETGTVRQQQVFLSVQQLPKVRFKDGREESMSNLTLVLSRELTPWLYGTAQAGSAARGSAGAYSIGLFGLGLQTPKLAGGARLGAELLGGVAGGGGVATGGGAVMQAGGWAQWEWNRLRLRAGLGQWRTLGSDKQSSPLVSVSLGYAFGVLGQ